MSARGKIKDAVYAAGIVGEGGAGFPTHVKIDCAAKVVIANGAECEPLLRVDRHLMHHFADQVVEGLLLVMEQTGAERGVVALKEHYHKAVNALKAAIAGTPVELLFLNNFYPSGDEQQIVYAATGKVVPLGGLPLDVETVVCNVSTLIDIARAQKGETVTQKYVTVAGAVHQPKTLLAPIGTPLSLLIKEAGGCEEDCRFIIGGPCMGKTAENLDNEVVTKTTGGLLAFPVNHTIWNKRANLCERSYRRMQSMCSQCSRCTQMCPRHGLGLPVQPHLAMRAVCWGKPELLGDGDGVMGCCECGVCTYFACDFGLDPAGVMKMLKSRFTVAGAKPEKRSGVGAQGWGSGKQIPPSRLIGRLGVREYDRPAPMGGEVDPEMVRIPMKMHIGSPSKPLVKEGQAVLKGELIASSEGLGANIHASMSGSVSAVTSTYIEIRKIL